MTPLLLAWLILPVAPVAAASSTATRTRVSRLPSGNRDQWSLGNLPDSQQQVGTAETSSLVGSATTWCWPSPVRAGYCRTSPSASRTELACQALSPQWESAGVAVYSLSSCGFPSSRDPRLTHSLTRLVHLSSFTDYRHLWFSNISVSQTQRTYIYMSYF